MREILTKLINHEDLSTQEVTQTMNGIFSGEQTPVQISAFLVAMASKKETFEELAGAAKAMRSNASKIQVIGKPVIDTCGTGGDGLNTFNISTTTAFVVAGAGVKVAKHGNRSVSSKCGSADVLEELGVNIEVDPEIVEEAVNEIGIGFLYARTFHKAMKYVAPIRAELKVRSMFNLLGPLTNPAAANCQLLGVFDSKYTEMFANTLNLLGVKNAWVVHGHDGLDEMTVTDLTRVSELKDGLIKTYDIDPEDYFEERALPEELTGGDPQTNAEIATRIFDGEKGARRNIVVLNAGAALVAAEKAKNLKEGIKLAQEVIDSGKAKEKLNQLVHFA